MDDQHFKQFKEESLSQLKMLQPQDVEIFNEDFIEENYTFVLRPDFKTLEIIQLFLKELKTLEPNQYYYNLEKLHLTLIGNIPKDIDVKILCSTIETVLKQYSFNFELKGLGSNKYCSSFSVYPKNFSIHNFREAVRKKINLHGDNYSSILESYEYVGWINYLRYLQAPKQEFLDFLYSCKDKSFGEMKPTIAQLYKNTSKVLDPKKATLIKSFSLQNRS